MHTRLVLALLVASVAAAPVSRANPSKKLELQERGILGDSTESDGSTILGRGIDILDTDSTATEKRGILGDSDILDSDSTATEKRGILEDGDILDTDSTAAEKRGILGDSDILEADSTGAERRGVLGDGDILDTDSTATERMA